jgi:hypothetical protein
MERRPPGAGPEWDLRRRLLAAVGRTLPPAPVPVWPLVAVGAAVWDGWTVLEGRELFLWQDPGVWPDLQGEAFWRSVWAVRALRPRAAFLVIPRDDHPARLARWAARLQARRTPVALARDPARWWDPEGWRRWGPWPAPRPGPAPDPPPAAGWALEVGAARSVYRTAGEAAARHPAAARILLQMGGTRGWWRVEELEAFLGPETAQEGVAAGVRAGLLEEVAGRVRATPAGRQVLRRLLPSAGGEERRAGNPWPDSFHSKAIARALAGMRRAGWEICGGGREALLAGRGSYAVPDAVVLARDRLGRPWLWILELFRQNRSRADQQQMVARRAGRLLALLGWRPTDPYRLGIWIVGPTPGLQALTFLVQDRPEVRWHLARWVFPPDPEADRAQLPAALRY